MRQMVLNRCDYSLVLLSTVSDRSIKHLTILDLAEISFIRPENSVANGLIPHTLRKKTAPHANNSFEKCTYSFSEEELDVSIDNVARLCSEYKVIAAGFSFV